MGFLTALADATPIALLASIAAVWAANVTEAISPLLLGPLAGIAVLAAGTLLSRTFQTDERRFPVLRGTFELLTVW